MALLVFLLAICVAFRALTWKRWFYRVPNTPLPGSGTFESPIENRMFYALRREGLDPIPQYPVGRYRLDFAVFDGGRKIAVECDGKAYHSSPTQKAHDRRRDSFLRKNGWTVMRFSGSQINRGPSKCAKKVKQRCI